MLYINNPDTYRAVIDERRRSDGQYATEQAPASHPAPGRTVAARWTWNRYRPQPAPAA